MLERSPDEISEYNKLSPRTLISCYLEFYDYAVPIYFSNQYYSMTFPLLNIFRPLLIWFFGSHSLTHLVCIV